MSGHACQDCGWCHDFGTYGFCQNRNVKMNELNKLTYEDLVQDNQCEHFDDDIWLGG